ncbi:MAG TPA: hypothetical protein VM219_04835 [Phycisphaerae bacterium]|nr:hypothetical protein [Phycisphaerae bacterium]
MKANDFIAKAEPTSPDVEAHIREHWAELEPLASEACHVDDLVLDQTEDELSCTIRAWGLKEEPPVVQIRLRRQGEDAAEIYIGERTTFKCDLGPLPHNIVIQYREPRGGYEQDLREFIRDVAKRAREAYGERNNTGTGP